MSWRPMCAVSECFNKGRHAFPVNLVTQQKWFQALRSQPLVCNQRKMRRVGLYSKICSDHFKQSDFIPSVMDATSSKIIPKRLKCNAVPSIFPWTSHDSENQPVSNKVSKTYSKSVLPVAYVEMLNTETNQDSTDRDHLPIQQIMDFGDKNEVTKESDPLQILSTDGDDPNDVVHFCDAPNAPYMDVEYEICVYEECKTDDLNPEDNDENKTVVTEDKGCQTDKISQTAFCIETYEHDDKAIHFYTGLESYKKFIFVFQTLGDSSELKYIYGSPPKDLLPLNQFFLTLIILRQHLTFQQMSMMFRIQIKQIYNIYITWIRFMALQWRRIDIWPDRETVHALAPLDFYDKYPMTRVILDATEFPIQKPKLPLAQQITFSSYKNRNTAKVLIGITPGGLISYVSPTYGGSATDRQIIERCSILNRFDFKDEIMVDKGLNVQDILIGYGVKVNMPSFFKKANQIDPYTLVADRKVASKRVHVERVIGLLKTYKILKQPMNKTNTLLCRDIVFICCMLVNFRSNIINNTA